MRTLKISLLVIILSITISAQWEWTNPKPSGNSLKKIFFLDSSTGWIVGNRGTFLRFSSEYGWVFKYDDEIRDDISSVFFSDKFSGVAISAAIGSTQQGRFYKSSDGGESWNQIFLFNNKLYDFFFLNDFYGWVVGKGIISKTTNGGISWNDQLLNSSYNFNSCYFIDSLIGWAVGNVLFHTLDGGQTWIQQTLPISGLYVSIDFSNNMDGWIAGSLPNFPYNGTLLRSTDAGNNWFEHPISSSGITCVNFVNDSSGWLSNKTGELFKTTNNGNDWLLISSYNRSIENMFF